MKAESPGSDFLLLPTIIHSKLNNGYSEEELISGCVRKSEKHQELLYKQYFGYVKSICRAYSSDHEMVLEITDDSFIKVFDAIKKYDPNQSFKKWLRRITVNTAIDHYRKNKRHLNSLSITESSSFSLGIDMVDQLTIEDIYKLINVLPDQQKIVFNLYEIEGFSHTEISKLLGIPESSSRVYLTRAKQKLKELVKKHFI